MIMPGQRHLTAAVIAVILALPVLAAATEPLVWGHREALTSTILDEERELLVQLPGGYEDSATRYPVLYLLDGRSHFRHAAGLVQYLAATGRIPEMIVVGVVSTDRNRDFTPERIRNEYHDYPTSGGADDFLRFLAEELIPHMETRYRTVPFRILLGHSFGGLFATHAALTSPDLFAAVVAASPNLHWINEQRLAAAPATLAATADRPVFLYYTISEDEGVTAPLQVLVDAFAARTPDQVSWHFTLLAGEDHTTTPHTTLYRGLLTLYDDWKLHHTALQAEGAAAVRRHYAALTARFGYAITPDESWLNRYGYWLLHDDRQEQGLGLLAYAVELYPESWNAHDSLGEALHAAGRDDEAAEHLERSLALNPENDHARELLREIEE